MAYTYKKKKEPYLSPADIKRIAAMDNNPAVLYKKFKVGITLKHPKISAELYIICYGKDKTELKSNIDSHVSFFKKADKKWSLVKIDDLKNKDEETE